MRREDGVFKKSVLPNKIQTNDKNEANYGKVIRGTALNFTLKRGVLQKFRSRFEAHLLKRRSAVGHSVTAERPVTSA